MENSPELKALIRKNASLFWYTKEDQKENLPLPVVLEFFINYADIEDAKALFKIVGIENAAKVFFEQINGSKRLSNNITPLSKNYYSLFFKKYAPGNIKRRTKRDTTVFKPLQ